MAKEIIAEIFEEQELGGVSENVLVANYCRATPNTGGSAYVRYHNFQTGKNYIWSDDPFLVDENTSETDPNWTEE
jgi:hypothetical protein